jgi:hypothetical protein
MQLLVCPHNTCMRQEVRLLQVAGAQFHKCILIMTLATLHLSHSTLRIASHCMPSIIAIHYSGAIQCHSLHALTTATPCTQQPLAVSTPQPFATRTPQPLPACRLICGTQTTTIPTYASYVLSELIPWWDASIKPHHISSTHSMHTTAPHCLHSAASRCSGRCTAPQPFAASAPQAMTACPPLPATASTLQALAVLTPHC